MLKKNRMHLCPMSAVGSNIKGQPPSITVIPCCRPYSVAADDTLPVPTERCIHTFLIPSSALSRMVASAVSGLVPITTALDTTRDRFQIGIGAIPLHGVGIGVDGENLIAPLPQALVHNVAAVSLRVTGHPGHRNSLRGEKLGGGVLDRDHDATIRTISPRCVRSFSF